MLKIEIELGNEAFKHGQRGNEIARILVELAHRIMVSKLETMRSLDVEGVTLRDINGNRVGHAEIH